MKRQFPSLEIPLEIQRNPYLEIPPRKTQDPNENLTMAQVLHRSTTVSLPNIRKSTSQV